MNGQYVGNEGRIIRILSLIGFIALVVVVILIIDYGVEVFETSGAYDILKERSIFFLEKGW